MMITISMASALLPLSVYAAAMPATAQQAFPEVRPGPGLPSLASLNLTSAQLYQEKPAPPRHGLHTLAADFTPFCGGNGAAKVDDVIACYNYLTSLGAQAQCGAPPTGVQFCYAGTAQVRGAVYNTDMTENSPCSDVAEAVEYVLTNCNNGGLVEGEQAAYGNGNLIVVVEAN